MASFYYRRGIILACLSIWAAGLAWFTLPRAEVLGALFLGGWVIGFTGGLMYYVAGEREMRKENRGYRA